jgi:hypothetical protein
MSVWAIWVQKDKKIMTMNQVRFNEHDFPFWKRKMVEHHLSDNSTDILFQQAFYVTWVPYNKLHASNYRKVHNDKMSDVVVLKVESQKNTYTQAIKRKYLADSNELLRTWEKENNPIHAHFAGER